MSETQTKKIALTEKQLAWTRAFMRAMGMGSGEGLDVRVVAETQQSKIKGSLEHADQTVDRQMGQSLKKNSGVSGSGEKVGRGLAGAGKGYKTDVVEKVNAVLKKADQLAKTGKVSDEIQRLIKELTESRDGYEEREEGEKNKSKLDQRQRKVGAIENRVEALQGLLDDAERSRYQEVNYMSGKQRLDALVSNPAILETLTKQGLDDKVRDAALQRLADENPVAFSGKPELLGIYLKSRPPVEKITNILDNADSTGGDALVAQVVTDLGGDKRLMNAICDTLVKLEAASKGSKTTFFRGNTTATKATKAFAVSGPESKKFLDDAVSARNAAFDGMPDTVEIDPEKITEKDEGKRAKLLKDSLKYIEDSCTAFLNALYRLPVPDNVATTAYMISGAAKSKQLSNEEVGIMVGGHLLLRIVNPMLTNAPKSPGQKLAANEMRLMVLVSKTIQNISNHIVKPEAGKEEYMRDLVTYTKTQIPMMDQWCANVARKGEQILKG